MGLFVNLGSGLASLWKKPEGIIIIKARIYKTQINSRPLERRDSV